MSVDDLLNSEALFVGLYIDLISKIGKTKGVDSMPDDTITDVKGLREIYPEPKGSPVEKVRYELDDHCRSFIARSPFLVLGTSGDVSPKGDNPGFVRVLDNKTILNGIGIGTGIKINDKHLKEIFVTEFDNLVKYLITKNINIVT